MAYVNEWDFEEGYEMTPAVAKVIVELMENDELVKAKLANDENHDLI